MDVYVLTLEHVDDLMASIVELSGTPGFFLVSHVHSDEAREQYERNNRHLLTRSDSSPTWDEVQEWRREFFRWPNGPAGPHTQG